MLSKSGMNDTIINFYQNFLDVTNNNDKNFSLGEIFYIISNDKNFSILNKIEKLGFDYSRIMKFKFVKIRNYFENKYEDSEDRLFKNTILKYLEEIYRQMSLKYDIPYNIYK